MTESPAGNFQKSRRVNARVGSVGNFNRNLFTTSYMVQAGPTCTEDGQESPGERRGHAPGVVGDVGGGGHVDGAAEHAAGGAVLAVVGVAPAVLPFQS